MSTQIKQPKLEHNWEEKQLYGYFKQQTDEITHKIALTWLRKENLKRKTELLLIATQNNAISTNYSREKLCNSSKCRLCWERDEKVNHTISK